MLIDIFARRYESVQLRDSLEERDGRLLVQAFRILSEDIYPYYRSGKEDSRGVRFWTDLQATLSRELGLKELSSQWFTNTTTWNGNATQRTHKFSLVTVCENWMMSPVNGTPNRHIKERLSLVELGFREREVEIASMNTQPIDTTSGRHVATLGTTIGTFADPRNYGEQIRQMRAGKTAAFSASVDELNARFRQSGYSLHYHNGFIQAATDPLVQSVVETPFWAIVADSRWLNVDTDMKEALDLRDSDGRDPAFFAARALESAIKIISDKKGWTTGNEKGAHNYVDNLASKSNVFIAKWESESLKGFFGNVRNPFGHGPGSAQMPKLTRQQTEWAIEFSMSWIKSLIRRT